MTALEDQARAIFFAVIGRPADQWAAAVDAACGNDGALRARVEQLLYSHQAQGSIHASTATTGDPATSELAGTVIGAYKLVEPVGEGGMGTVWMARQQEPVKRLVAVKVIKAGMDSRQVLARFEAERQALALMDHPNIAKVLDAGATPSGRPYFVMELVKGTPITKYCDDNCLPPRGRLELFVQVCQAVQHAHQKGVIHRDLKPSNILVAPYDGRPVVKVIDFGVAKAAGVPLTDKTLVTGLGTVVGTLEYMSPEQAELNNRDVDTRSDIYCLGILLYELLTGTTPLTRGRLKGAAFMELLRLIREEEPPRPSTRLSGSTDSLPSISAQRHMEPAKLTRLVRGELDWIVMKALEKDRNRRYETANGFAADVQRYLADEPVQACSPSPTYRLRKFVRRNTAALAVTGLSLLILLTLTGGIGWNVRDRAARQAAVEQEVNLALKEAEEHRDHGKWPEALAAAKRAEGLLAGGASDELRDRVGQLRKDLDMVLRLDDIRVRSSDTFDFDRDDRAYAQAFADYGIDVARLPADEAAALIRGRSGVAIALTTALDDWASSRARKDEAGGLALTAVAQAADPDPWRRQVREAHRRHDYKALAALAASPELMRQPPTTLVFLATAFQARGKPEPTIEVLRRAQRQYPGDFWINLKLASALTGMAPPDRQERVSFIRAALAARPQSVGAHNLLGFFLAQQGKLDEAVDTYRRGLELDPTFTWARIHLGMALQKQGKVGEAVDCYRKAIDLDPHAAGAHIVLANALVDQKKVAEAVNEYRRAIDLDPKEGPARRQGFGSDLGKKGWDVANHPDPKARDPKSAVDLANGAVEIAPQSAEAWQYLGWVQYRVGNWKASVEALEKSCELQGGGDGAQWIVMCLAHGKMATERDLPESDRARHRAEARRLYEPAVKQLDQWSLGGDPWAQAIRAFRAEATELLGVKPKPK